MAKKDEPAAKPPGDAKPSREDQARQAAQEYAEDQRNIIETLRKPN